MSEKTDKPGTSGSEPEDLGTDFEVIEDAGKTDASAKPDAPASPDAGKEKASEAKPGDPSPAGGKPAEQAPAGDAPKVPPAQSPPPRSAESWESLGLGLALAGLLVPWHTVEGSMNLVHGMLLALTAWWLLRHGLAAVHPSRTPLNKVLPALLLVWSGVRLAFAFGGNASLEQSFGWIGDSGEGQAGSNLAGEALGAWITLVGAVVCLVGATLGRKKDTKLPPRGPATVVDGQFSRSLMAYMLVFVGLMMSWSSSGERGVDTVFGALTLVLTVLMLWASWVGMWRLWTMPLVTGGKLPLLLFVTPLEAAIYAIAGLARAATQPEEGILLEAWPRAEGKEEHFLIHGGGPVLVMVGAVLAITVLFKGTKEAQEMIKKRKEDEIARRKAEREARKRAASEKSGAPGGSGPEKKDAGTK